jgi:hypothetical protein
MDETITYISRGTVFFCHIPDGWAYLNSTANFPLTPAFSPSAGERETLSPS